MSRERTVTDPLSKRTSTHRLGALRDWAPNVVLGGYGSSTFANCQVLRAATLLLGISNSMPAATVDLLADTGIVSGTL